MIKKIYNKLNAKSLQWQLLSRFFLILIVLLVILGVFQYLTTRNYLCRSKGELLSSKFHDLNPKFLVSMQNPQDIETNASFIANKLSGVNINVSIVNKSGNILVNSESTITTIHKKPFGKDKISYISSIPKLSKNQYMQILNQPGNIEKFYELVKDENHILQFIMWRKIGPIDSPLGLIQLSTPAQDVNDILTNQIYIYIGASTLILVLGAFLGATIFKRTLNPLSNMTNTVEQININQLHTRLSENSGQLEIDTLSCSFNAMLERIETSFEKEQLIKEKMRQFVSDASHELRTPLTSIHGFVEVLLRGAAKNENQLNLALNTILIESKRLTKLINDLLLLTKLDQKVPIEMKVENINKAIEEVFPQLQILSGKRKIHLKLEENITVNANRNQIKQVLFNLIENSVRHTNEDTGEFTLSTSIEDSYAVLKISDNGSGMPKEHLVQIFDRFFRSESHRSREHGGYGLGLSIVKSIVDAHDGKITVESDLGSGTVFSIYLELAHPFQ